MMPVRRPLALLRHPTPHPLEDTSMKYVCKMCGFEYDPAEGDPDSGIAPGTQFKDIPEDWSCPICGASKSDFEPA